MIFFLLKISEKTGTVSALFIGLTFENHIGLFLWNFSFD